MPQTLRSIMLFGKQENYGPEGDSISRACENYKMDESAPNNLEAWRKYRRLTQLELARRVETTQGQIAHLEAGRVELSAKWLRRLAPALGTTPGMLLDHNPNKLDADIIEIWANANERQQRQLTDIAKTLVQFTGTGGGGG